jgi:hypothetical protein
MDPRRWGLTNDDLSSLGYKVKAGGGGEEEKLGALLDRVAKKAGEDDDLLWEFSPRKRAAAQKMWFWTLVALLTFSWAASINFQIPSTVPANRPDSVFSSSRAMSQLVEIARRPHPPGSPEHHQVRTYLVDRLRTLGLDPQIQTTTRVTHEAESVSVVGVNNIVARVAGTAPTGAVALTAHYDAAPLSAGAGDAGVGVVTILETVRAVLAGEPLRNDLIIVFADGGTMGQAGVRAFVDEHPWMEEIRLVMSVETRGVSGPSITFETKPENGRLIQEIGLANPQPAASSLSRALAPPEAFGLDLQPFREKGVQGLNLTALGGMAAHHQVTDRAEAVDERTLAHHGLQLLALSRHFGETDLGTEAGWVEPDRVYLSFPLFGLAHHESSLVPFISFVLLGIWLLVGFTFKVRKGNFRGILNGVGVGVAVVLGSAALGKAFFEILLPFHPEYGFLESAFFNDGLHFLALTALVLALVTGALGVARRWIGTAELFFGPLLVPLGISLWMGFRSPLGAFALQWPLALSLLSVGLLAGLGKERLFGRWGWLVTLLISFGVISVVVPNLEIMAAILTFRSAAVFGGAIAVGFILILPLLDWLTRPQLWLTPSLATAVALILAVIASPAVQGASRQPEFSSLVLLVEDSLEVSASGSVTLEAQPNPMATRRVTSRWLTIPGPGEAWALSWVAEEETGFVSPGVLLLPQEDQYLVAGTGPETHMAPPQISILDLSVRDGHRSLQIAVRTGLEGQMIGLRLPGRMGGFTSVDGSTWGRPNGSGAAWTLSYWGDPAKDVISVGIDLAPGQDSVELEILEHHLQVVEVLGEGFFRRNESLIPNAPAGSDRIIQRTRVRLMLGTL